MTLRRGLLFAALTVLSIAPRCAFSQEPPPPNPATLHDTPPVPACNEDRLAVDQDLGAKQRACIFFHQATAPSALFGAGAATAYAALTQTEDPRFGTGWKSVDRGFAARYTQSVTKSAGEYVASLIARQDPRPATHAGSTGRRIRAAAASLVVTTETGSFRFKPAPLVGAAAGGFVALAWQPRNRQTVDHAFVQMGTSLAGSLAGAEFHEFEAEIMRWVSNHLEPKLK
jgi:hypothetical protein